VKGSSFDVSQLMRAGLEAAAASLAGPVRLVAADAAGWWTRRSWCEGGQRERPPM